MAFSLEAKKRDQHGTSVSRKLRREGSIPATVYGNKTEPISISVTQQDVLKLTNSGKRRVNLEIDGKTHTSIIKDVQYHPVKDLPIHIDFLMIQDGIEVSTRVPVKLLNQTQAHGVKMGGQLKNYLHFLKVKATPETLPEVINVDIINLDTAKSFLVRDLPAADYKIINPASEAICKITKAREK